MLFLPVAVRDDHISDASSYILSNRHTEPLQPVWRLDLVSVAPIIFCELHVVVEDEFIYGSNHIEVTLPWDVIGLENRDLFHAELALDWVTEPKTDSRDQPCAGTEQFAED